MGGDSDSESSDEHPENLRVVYISDLECKDKDILKELYNIVHVAAKFNRSHEIGGFFCADKDAKTVVQMFEGKYDVTEELWENIQGDTRHKIRPGYQVSHPETTLKKWGMPLMEPVELLERLTVLGIDTDDLIKEVEKPKQEEKADDALMMDLEQTASEMENAKKNGKGPLNQAELAKRLAVQMAELKKARDRSMESLKNSKEPVEKDHIADLEASYALLAKYASSSSSSSSSSTVE